MRLKFVLDIKCLFMSETMLIFFFVDDVVVVYDSKYINQMNRFQESLFHRLEMHVLDGVE